MGANRWAKTGRASEASHNELCLLLKVPLLLSHHLLFPASHPPTTAFETEPSHAQSSGRIALVLHRNYLLAEVPSIKWNSLWFFGERSY